MCQNLQNQLINALLYLAVSHLLTVGLVSHVGMTVLMTFKLFCVICDGPGYLPLKWDKGDKGEDWEDIKQGNNLRVIKSWTW